MTVSIKRIIAKEFLAEPLCWTAFTGVPYIINQDKVCLKNVKGFHYSTVFQR